MLSAPACVPDAIAHYEPTLPRQRLPQATQCDDFSGHFFFERSFLNTHDVAGDGPLAQPEPTTIVSIRKKSLVADEPSRSRHTVVHHAGPGHLEVRHTLWRALIACEPTSHAWICTPTTALAHPSGRSTAALLASRDLLPRPQVSSLMHYEGRAPRRRAGIVSASPAAVLLAARPRAGLILLS